MAVVSSPGITLACTPAASRRVTTAAISSCSRRVSSRPSRGNLPGRVHIGRVAGPWTRHAPRRQVLAGATPVDGPAHRRLPRDGRPGRPAVGLSADAAARPRRGQERRERTTPLVYVADGTDIVLVASKGGNPKNPAWYHNLKANPDTTVQVGSEQKRACARGSRTTRSASASGPWRSRRTGVRGATGNARTARSRCSRAPASAASSRAPTTRWPHVPILAERSDDLAWRPVPV